MSTKKPVVLYGASGFSGRLVAEFLREYNVPFIAAGRSRVKIEEVLSRVPGIETADYEVAETGNSAEELVKLFSGAKVVCNTVGPFLYHGPRVVEASLKAGCHYLDISGEQAWIRNVADNWGEKFAQKGLLIAPATAYMSAASDIASHICIETGGIDTLEILSIFKGIPTFGSTQTIFAVIQTDAFYLEQNRYKPWGRATGHEAIVPGSIESQLVLPWGGFPNPVWFKNHPQVANVRTLGGILDRALMTNILATEKHYEEQIRPLPERRAGTKACRNGELGAGRNSAARKRTRTSHHRFCHRTRYDCIFAVRDIWSVLLPANRPHTGFRRASLDSCGAAQDWFCVACCCIWTSRTPPCTRRVWTREGKDFFVVTICGRFCRRLAR